MVTADGNFLYTVCSYWLEVNFCRICYEPFAQLNYLLALNITHVTRILCLSLLKRKAQAVWKKYFLGQLPMKADDVLDSAKRNFSECFMVETLRNCIDERLSPIKCILALSTDPKGSRSFRPNYIVPMVVINNEDVQANVPKIYRTKISFTKHRIKHSSLCSSIYETVSDYSREGTSSLDSCSQEAPCSRADDMASGKSNMILVFS